MFTGSLILIATGFSLLYGLPKMEWRHRPAWIKWTLWGVAVASLFGGIAVLIVLRYLEAA